MQQLTVVEYVAMAGSALIILNCLFKCGYWAVWMGVRLKHIPFSGYPQDEHVRHSAPKLFFDSYFAKSKSTLHSPSNHAALTPAAPATHMLELQSSSASQLDSETEPPEKEHGGAERG